MTGFAGDGGHVLVYVGQPVGMSLLRIVAGLAASHGALKLGSDVVLGALPTGKIMVWLLKIFADIQHARVVEQVIGLGLLGLIGMSGIIQRIVAVGALQLALGVDIPGPVEFVLATQVHT